MNITTPKGLLLQHVFILLIHTQSAAFTAKKYPFYGIWYGGLKTDQPIHAKQNFILSRPPQRLGTQLFGKGKGQADQYSWTENRNEVELTIKVPPNTKSREISFKAAPYGIELKLNDEILLSADRQLRGKLRMDGTYWSIMDSEDITDQIDSNYREVKVCIEKHRFLGDVECDDDWGGVFLDDKSEVIRRDYEPDEELDMDEYFKRLGVDVNNLKEDDIDKSMFSSQNMTQNAFEKLLESGFAREALNEQDRIEDHMVDSANTNSAISPPPGSSYIPTSKTNDDDFKVPLGTSFETEELLFDEDDEEVEVELVEKDDTLESMEDTFRQYLGDKKLMEGQDPIDALTVNQLKEMCRDYKLKLTGNKDELKDRVRDHIMRLFAHDFVEPDSDTEME